MDRGYVDFRRLYALHQAGDFFVTRTKINMNYHRVYSRAVDKTDTAQMLRIILPRVEAVKGEGLIETQTRHLVDLETGKRLIFSDQSFCAARPDHCGALQAALARRIVEAADEATVLYVDGHVCGYHGTSKQLPKHYVARQRLCLSATADYWVNARRDRPNLRQRPFP
jgi:prepilin-type processing-associated H-X9-DG protein